MTKRLTKSIFGHAHLQLNKMHILHLNLRCQNALMSDLYRKWALYRELNLNSWVAHFNISEICIAFGSEQTRQKILRLLYTVLSHLSSNMSILHISASEIMGKLKWKWKGLENFLDSPYCIPKDTNQLKKFMSFYFLLCRQVFIKYNFTGNSKPELLQRPITKKP